MNLYQINIHTCPSENTIEGHKIQSEESSEVIIKAIALKEMDKILKETGKAPQKTHYSEGLVAEITSVFDFDYENRHCFVILTQIEGEAKENESIKQLFDLFPEYEIEHKYIKAIKNDESTMGILGILNSHTI